MICAIVVGLVFTSGLGTLLPIMQVLIREGSVQDWVNRKVIEARLDLRLVDDTPEVQIADLGNQASKALKPGQELWPVGVVQGHERESVTSLLAELSDPNQSRARVVVDEKQ